MTEFERSVIVKNIWGSLDLLKKNLRKLNKEVKNEKNDIVIKKINDTIDFLSLLEA
jgi:hypothetical protein